MGATQANASILERAVRASRLDAHLYEEVEHDPRATREAAVIVVVTSVLAAIGGGVVAGPVALIAMTVAGIMGWAAYAYITYFVGTRMLAGPDTSATWGELARTLGYANAPRALLILGIVPPITAIVAAVVALWVLAATIVALRAALDFSTGRAVVTAIIGWLVQALVIGLLWGLAAVG